MDVLETKYLSKDLNFLIKVLQLDDNPIRLVGTGSMASQYYPADFDFLCNVKKDYNAESLFKAFKKIIDNIDDNKLFFIEFKLQQEQAKGKEQKKHKIFKKEELTQEFFTAFFKPNTELCKIDAIIWYDGKFKEVSCIYFFSSSAKPLNMKKYIQALLDDQKHYYNDGKIYKSLKRLMLSAKYENPPDTNLIIAITRFFNSAVGKLYELDNIIQAGIIYMNKFGVDERMIMFVYNLGFGLMNPSKLEQLSKDYQKIINGEAQKLYKYYDLPVGHLPPWNSIRPKISN